MRRQRQRPMGRSPTGGKCSRLLVLLAAAGCFLAAAVQAAGLKEATEEYQGLTARYIRSAPSGEDAEPNSRSKQGTGGTEDRKKERKREEVEEAQPPSVFIDHQGLVRENPDYVGWLYFDFCGVSCPLVRDRDGDGRYLHRTFSGMRSPAGAIFLERDADPDFGDPNTFLFGHNMRNGTMFGNLKKFVSDPPETAPRFWIGVSDGAVLHYQVFAAVIVPKDSDLFRVPLDGKAYDQYLREVRARAFYLKEEALPEGRIPLVTLSTCSGAQGTSKRLLVFGALRENRTEDGNIK